jgi:hypothetical protein
MLSTPEGRAELARQEQGQRMRAPRFPLPPEQRAERQRLIREWRARRMAGIPLTPEEQALRRERQQWRMQRQAGQPPLTEEQRAFRQEQFRRWREARRARWQTMTGQSPVNSPAETEGPAAPAR